MFGVRPSGFGLLAVISAVAAESSFNWTAINPTPDLRYHDCFNGFRCARLRVPLDWQNTSDTRTVALAITALPATVSEDDPSFGGTIIMITGGPGSSGVDFVQGFGPEMKLIAERNKHYEVLSYDPRGAGYSTPTVDCFGGDWPARTAFLETQFWIGPLDRSRDALERQGALNSAYGTLCQETMKDSGILAHVAIVGVARDIVEMLDRFDELRRKRKAIRHPGIRNKDRRGVPAARLQGYAYSYGTIVANTFASMYPGRVRRLIVDAAVDANDSMHGV